jgi:hypothetical protein
MPQELDRELANELFVRIGYLETRLALAEMTMNPESKESYHTEVEKLKKIYRDGLGMEMAR